MILDRLGETSQTSKNGNRGSLVTRRLGLLSAHHWLVTDRFAAEARKTKVAGWGALNDKPNCLYPAYRHKNGFPFPPEVILGGFLFGDEPPRTDVNDYAACIQVFALVP